MDEINNQVNNNCREMTHEELKICHKETIQENEDLKIINELLIANIRNLRSDTRYLQGKVEKLEKELKRAKEIQVERKKEKLLGDK